MSQTEWRPRALRSWYQHLRNTSERRASNHIHDRAAARSQHANTQAVLRIQLQMRTLTMHTCPVCGYDSLTEPPSDFSICPSCGTEFGYDDAFSTHDQLRAAWLKGGAKWWSPVDHQPTNWDPYSQINNLIEPSTFQAVLQAAAVRFFGSLAQRDASVAKQPQQQDLPFTSNTSPSQRFTRKSPLEYANAVQPFFPPQPHSDLNRQNAA